ncbi:VQ protein [Dillenia turbinata]|uniref:VQ protein n=1 Tax=Dillenia turbinata TaxID=194707 RepID=A0AAN8ZDD0_9MAGN
MMDVSRVNHMKSQRQAKRKKRTAIKVVYISSPMKVKTRASEFRALVQKLTGRESDAVGFMEINSGANSWTLDHDQELKAVDDYVSPTSSGSVFEPSDDVFAAEIEDDFARNFTCSLLYDNPQVDAFENFVSV